MYRIFDVGKLKGSSRPAKTGVRVLGAFGVEEKNGMVCSLEKVGNNGEETVV